MSQKHLKVEYNGIVLFDGMVDEVAWTDNANGVTVSGKLKKAGGGGLMDLLAGAASGASRRQTESIVAERRAELVAERGGDRVERVVGE